MKIRNILIALVVIGAGISGAMTMVVRPAGQNTGKSIVVNRPIGVAYAQEGGVSPPPGGGAPTPPPPPAGGGDASAPPAGGADAAKDAKPAAPQLSDEEWLKKLDEWKNSDPRDILKAKYKDLQSKETHPENEDDPENFIPETGRIDPLTIVSGAIPDELKPPRSGETDQNEAETYLYSAAATEAVDAVGIGLEVYNVLQIGLEKIVSVAPKGGRRFNLREGGGFSMVLSTSQGIPVQVDFSLSSASTSEVIITVSGTPYGSNVTISKDFHYIPR